jgi:DNA-binding XRE family transcriptional regulator
MLGMGDDRSKDHPAPFSIKGSYGHNPSMANLVSVLKSEVARLARKELRAETENLKKTVATQRSEIAALKRRVGDLEKAVKALVHLVDKAGRAAKPVQTDPEEGQFRFRASGMASNRKRLGLSAEDFGLLVGASGQSVYLWEGGKTKPRAQNLAAIAALRGIGKREVAARLEALKQSA